MKDTCAKIFINGISVASRSELFNGKNYPVFIRASEPCVIEVILGPEQKVSWESDDVVLSSTDDKKVSFTPKKEGLVEIYCTFENGSNSEICKKKLIFEVVKFLVTIDNVEVPRIIHYRESEKEKYMNTLRSELDGILDINPGGTFPRNDNKMDVLDLFVIRAGETVNVEAKTTFMEPRNDEFDEAIQEFEIANNKFVEEEKEFEKAANKFKKIKEIIVNGNKEGNNIIGEIENAKVEFCETKNRFVSTMNAFTMVKDEFLEITKIIGQPKPELKGRISWKSEDGLVKPKNSFRTSFLPNKAGEAKIHVEISNNKNDVLFKDDILFEVIPSPPSLDILKVDKNGEEFTINGRVSNFEPGKNTKYHLFVYQNTDTDELIPATLKPPYQRWLPHEKKGSNSPGYEFEISVPQSPLPVNRLKVVLFESPSNPLDNLKPKMKGLKNALSNQLKLDFGKINPPSQEPIKSAPLHQLLEDDLPQEYGQIKDRLNSRYRKIKRTGEDVDDPRLPKWQRIQDEREENRTLVAFDFSNLAPSEDKMRFILNLLDNGENASDLSQKKKSENLSDQDDLEDVFRIRMSSVDPQIRFLLTMFSDSPVGIRKPNLCLIKNPKVEARLIRSYFDRDQCYLYDQALAVICFIHAGMRNAAESILNALNELQIPREACLSPEEILPPEESEIRRYGSWYFAFNPDGTTDYDASTFFANSVPKYKEKTADLLIYESDFNWRKIYKKFTDFRNMQKGSILPDGKVFLQTVPTDDYRPTGAIVWVGMALNYYHLKYFNNNNFLQSDYYAMTLNLLKFLCDISREYTPAERSSEEKCLGKKNENVTKIKPDKSHSTGNLNPKAVMHSSSRFYSMTWDQTQSLTLEHNLDFYSFLQIFSQYFAACVGPEVSKRVCDNPDPEELRRRLSITTSQVRKFIFELWRDDKKVFSPGRNLKTKKINKDDIYLDTQSWTYLTLDGRQLSIEERKILYHGLCKNFDYFFTPAGYTRYQKKKKQGIAGFFDGHKEGSLHDFAWTEGTLGMIMAMKKFEEDIANLPNDEIEELNSLSETCELERQPDSSIKMICTRFGLSYDVDKLLNEMNELAINSPNHCNKERGESINETESHCLQALGGIPYTTFSTDEEMAESLSVAGTTWLYLLNNGLNPFRPQDPDLPFHSCIIQKDE